MHLSRIPVYQGSVDSVVGILYAKSLLADIREAPTSSGSTSICGPLLVPEA